MKLVASSSQCVRFTLQYNGRDESSVIGNVRDPGQEETTVRDASR